MITPDDIYDHIYVEVDWRKDCEPDKEQLKKVADSFKRHGIILHIDAGEYSVNYDGEKKGGKLVYPTHYWNTESDIRELVEKNFSFRDRFRYCMYVDRINYYDTVDNEEREPLGISDDIPGKMFKIAKLSIKVGMARNERDINTEALTFMHELGHTLGLKHGGDENINYKPNYISIMNYLYTGTGIGTDGDNIFNYSEYALPAIKDFNNIDERNGLDPYDVYSNIKKFYWVKKKENETKVRVFEYDTSLNSLKGYPKNAIDFNGNDKIESSVKMDFYLKFNNDLVGQIFFDWGWNKNCKESINDWKVVNRNIVPNEPINYTNVSY